MEKAQIDRTMFK